MRRDEPAGIKGSRLRWGRGWALVLGAALLLAGGRAVAGLSVTPAEPRRGDAFFVRYDGGAGLERPVAEFDGVRFPLWREGDGTWAAIAATGRDSSAGKKELKLLDLARPETAVAVLPVRVADRAFEEQRLTVKESMVTLSPEDQKRADREREAINAALGASGAGKFWETPFLRPAPGVVTSAFGLRRWYNGKAKSPHGGVDLAAKRGEPVRASSDGRVLLVGDLFYTGWTVFLDHGNGLVTAYFHMDRARVAEGERVAAGDVVGEAGSTGRSTGVHLHWSVYVSGVRVDPLSLLALTAPGGKTP